jgi:hypothetical protein
MSSTFTVAGVSALVTGKVSLTTNQLKVMLLRATFVPSAAWNSVHSIVGHECNSTGYIGGFGGTGRRPLANVTLTAGVISPNHLVLTADDPVPWVLSGGTDLGHAAVIYEEINDVNSIVIATLAFGSVITPDGGPVQVQFNPQGIGAFIA